jgi:hypothetical protein
MVQEIILKTHGQNWPMAALAVSGANFNYFLINASAQNLSFEDYNPTSTLVVPGNIITPAKFPFIDLHGHQYGMATQDMSAVVAVMDSINMKVMVKMSDDSGGGLVKAVANVKQHFRGRFVVFCNVNFEGAGKPGWIENAVAQLETDVKMGLRGLKFTKASDYLIKMRMVKGIDKSLFPKCFFILTPAFFLRSFTFRLK